MNPTAQKVKQRLDELIRIFNKGNLAESERLCREILAMDPTNANALRLLGVAVRKISPDRGKESLQILRQAIACHPKSEVLYFELGNTYVELHEPANAYDCFQKAIELNPKFQQAYVNLSALTEEQERFTESLDWAKKAIGLQPKCHMANYNAGNALRELNRLTEAKDYYRRALETEPDFCRATWNMGVCELLQGNYRQGWKLFEARIAVGEVQVDNYTQPRWDGSPLADKTILVHAEQGIGDEIIFASVFPDVIQSARRTIIACEPRLEKLFRRSFPGAIVHGWLRLKSRAPMPVPEPFDVQVPAGSLLQYFRLTSESFPRRKRFLLPDEKFIDQWKNRFAALGTGLKIGISWRAGGKPAEGRKRSIPLADWTEILSTPGVHFVNLQYGDAGDQIAAVRDSLGVTIHDWEQGDPLIDMDEYAAKIAALDLVISVGNATVHMAGAVGTPTLAMLPLIPSWRWMAHGDYSPWYQSVRLFRQSAKGQWGDVLNHVALSLREKLGIADGQMISSATESKAIGPTDQAAERKNSKPTAWLDIFEVSQKGAERHFPEVIAEADAAFAQGDYAKAEAGYRQVLQLLPRMPVALIGLGKVAQATGRLDLAIRSFQRSLSQYEKLSENHTLLGKCLYEAGRLDEAERSLLRAVELNAHCGEALQSLGLLYFDDQRIEEAEQTLRHATKVQPHLAAAHASLGRVLLETGRVAPAIESLQRSLGCDANCYDALLYLGIAYQSQGQSMAAIRTLEKTLQLYPGNIKALHCLAHVQTERGQLEEALANFDEVIGRSPDFAPAHFGRSQILLQLGEWSLGWREYEWRWKLSEVAGQRHDFVSPQWDGSSLGDRTILLHGEQQIGEELLFATCYPDVISQAKRTVITCEPRLATLFARSFPTATVQPLARGREAWWQPPAGTRIDVQLAAGSLPRLLRASPKDFSRVVKSPSASTAGISSSKPLLAVDVDKASHWRERFQKLGDGLKIGIAWRGGNSPEDRRLRWMSLADMGPLFSMAGAKFLCLQEGNIAEEISQAAGRGISPILLPELKLDGDQDEVAAAISTLDLVIAADNAIGRLSGALGVPTWVLLPKFGPWQWLSGNDPTRTVWFDSVRLFRQERLGDWRGLLVTVGEKLLTFAGRATDSQGKPPLPPLPLPKPHWMGESLGHRR